jgi:putative DNA primase/helicase
VNRHGPCPICGGKDRFRFDDKDRRGTWICNQCGAGDGFSLAQKVNGWTFPETLNALAGYLGFDGRAVDRKASPPPKPRPVEKAVATQRVKDLLSTVTTPDLVADCVAYLSARNVWPLPADCRLYAHVGVEYRRQSEGKSWVSEGRFPCLVAPVQDVSGETVTAHVTYLEGGAKLARRDHADHPMAARKILSPMTGRQGCAVRLMRAGEVLGIAEGIETALSAHRIHGIPTWAALNTTLLAKFVPPPGVRHVVVFADRDVAGMEAAWQLRDQLDGRCTMELALPERGDWNEVAS